MKFEKLTDGLLEILNSFNYKYSLFDENGNKTSNPYDSRYIYVDRPNMMFILDKASNKIEFHKSNFKFSTFKKILNIIRKFTLEFFINLEVSNYNQSFKPKDFSKDIMRRRYNLEQEMDMVSENNNQEQTNTIFENFDGIVITHDLNENNEIENSYIEDVENNYSIDKNDINEVMYVVDLARKNSLNESNLENLRFLKNAYKRLDSKSKTRILSENEKKLYKQAFNFMLKLRK